MKLRHALPFGFVATFVVGLGCSSIPDVTFVDDAPDGSVTLPDGAVVPQDAGADANRPDTGARPDSSAPDASVPNTCPGSPPAGYLRCCGSVPCAGEECEANCGECQTKCGSNDGCCSRKNNVTCRPRSSFVCN